MEEQVRPAGWWSRNWKWVVPVLVVVVLLTIAGLVAGILIVARVATSVQGFLKSSGGYQQALTVARADPRVARVLGTPIEDGLLPSGNVEENGTGGSSDLAIPVSGPGGSGTLYVRATRSMGEWQLTQLVLEVKATGERIDLLADGGP